MHRFSLSHEGFFYAGKIHNKNFYKGFSERFSSLACRFFGLISFPCWLENFLIQENFFPWVLLDQFALIF